MNDFFDPLEPELFPLNDRETPEDRDNEGLSSFGPFFPGPPAGRLDRLRRWIRDIDL